MKLFSLVYGGVGVILAACTFFTGSHGLSETDRNIYDMAMGLESRMQENGFPDFSPADYAVRFFDGSADYVVADGAVRREEAVLDTFVGTAVCVDEEYQVLLSAYDNFAGLFSLLDTAVRVSEGEVSFAEESYSENAHVATLWHEAFHAWQCTRWETELDAQLSAAGLNESNLQEMIVNEVDSDERLVILFSEEMEALIAAYEATDRGEKGIFLAEALACEKERAMLLGEGVICAERYFQTIEGSARYVEAEAYRLLCGDDAWQTAYLGTFSYENGTGKYYEMGMYKCLLLDQLVPGWKERYTAVTDLSILLEERGA